MKTPFKYLVVDSDYRWIVCDINKGQTDWRGEFKKFHGRGLSRKFALWIIPAEVTNVTNDFGYQIEDKSKDWGWILVIDPRR